MCSSRLIVRTVSHIQGYVVHGILPPEGVTDADAEGGRNDMSRFGECYVMFYVYCLE